MKPELMKHFDVIFQAPQSCDFNVIETIWSLAKRKFRKVLALNPELKVQTEEAFKTTVKEVTESVALEHHKNVFRNNTKYIDKYLQVAEELGIDIE